MSSDLDYQNIDDWEPLFQLVKDHFQSIGVLINEVIYCNVYVIVILDKQGIDITKLPSRIARVRCHYYYSDEWGNKLAEFQARRSSDPAPGSPDDSEYNILQPGIRIASGPFPGHVGQFLSTTAGILIQDENNTEFLTVAAHGFPGQCGSSVFHPQAENGRAIGDLIMEVGATDIALVRLGKGERFCNITFDNDINPEPTRLQKLATAKSCQTGTTVYLDSPDTGLMEGMFWQYSYQRIPSDDVNQPCQKWVKAKWYYLGQDSSTDLPDSICGSAIWTENGDVVSFFHHAPKGGVMVDWCVGIASDELIERGFSVVDTTNREE